MTEHPLTILMAVAQYPPPVVGGLEKQAQELAAELAAQGHHITVLSGRVTPHQAAAAVCDGVTVRRLVWSQRRMVRWIALPFMIWRLFSRLVHGVDVVHVHSISGFGLTVITLAKLFRKPVLVKLPNIGAAGVPGLARGLLGPLRMRLFTLADAVVAMSSESLSELYAIGFDPRRVFATTNGIALDAAIPASVPGPDGTCRFVFVGRLEEEKGLIDLIRAVKILLADPTVGRFQVDLLGEGPLRLFLARDIYEHRLAGHIRLLGHVDDVPAVLPNYDVLVLPSHREGNSNAILEAMAAGLPVVSTRVGGTPLLVGDAGAKALHVPRDATALADLMKKLIADEALRIELGCEMRHRVLETFTIGKVAASYIQAYRLLAAGLRTQVGQASNPLVFGNQ